MPKEPESGEWTRSDKERLWWVEKNIKQLLRDHSAVVQAVEQLKVTVRVLEDYKLALQTRFDTLILLAKFVGIANAFNILTFAGIILYRLIAGKFPGQ